MCLYIQFFFDDINYKLDVGTIYKLNVAFVCPEHLDIRIPDSH